MILLIRHPATPWTARRYLGRLDLGWSPLGVAQADEIARSLAHRLHPGTRIVTSPLRRARMLAERLARASGVPVACDARWAEVDFGRYEGWTYEEIEADDPPFACALASVGATVDWPGGERAAEDRTRVIAAVDDLIAHNLPAVVVTHGGPLALAVAYALGLDVVPAPVPAGSGVVLDRAGRHRWRAQAWRADAR